MSLGTPSLQSNPASIVVVIQDINDQPPRFVCEQSNSSANSTCVFSEEIPDLNNPVGETIITLMVTDADQQSNISTPSTHLTSVLLFLIQVQYKQHVLHFSGC